ncbi:hypothetical protein TNCV_3676761 [Trichonephila clavipes]|nr:hypothetical protein TNCV_3676761 [Trichonephila clavipes]
MRSGTVSVENFNEDTKLSKSDCEESEENADEIDNIPVNFDVYVIRDGPKKIPQNSDVPGRFAARNVLRQSSGVTSFPKIRSYIANTRVVSLKIGVEKSQNTYCHLYGKAAAKNDRHILPQGWPTQMTLRATSEEHYNPTGCI